MIKLDEILYSDFPYMSKVVHVSSLAELELMYRFMGYCEDSTYAKELWDTHGKGRYLFYCNKDLDFRYGEISATIVKYVDGPQVGVAEFINNVELLHANHEYQREPLEAMREYQRTRVRPVNFDELMRRDSAELVEEAYARLRLYISE